MVTKRFSEYSNPLFSSVLAKIHMVTKHNDILQEFILRSVLAKIHMVTKHASNAHFKRCRFCSSKNSYGNKT